jgi:hypothetical protein
MNFSKLLISIHRFISPKNKTIDTNNNSQVITEIKEREVNNKKDNTKVLKKYSEFIEWENQMMKDIGLNCTMSRYPKNSIGKSENDIEVIFIKRKLI